MGVEKEPQLQHCKKCVCRLSNALFFHLIHFLEVTIGSCPGLSGLVNCTPARLIAFHSLIPDLQLHSSQSDLSMQMRRGELVILELECRVRMEQLVRMKITH